jgi:hypothetical protein
VSGYNNPGHEHAVSKKEALSIIEKIRAGKASVKGEARRLGVYHATLRKEMRAAIGSEQYDKLVLRGRRKRTAIGLVDMGGRRPKLAESCRGGRHGQPPKISDKVARAVLAKIEAGSSVQLEAQRLGVHHRTLRKAMRAVVGEEQYDKLFRVTTSGTKRREYRATSIGPAHVSQPKQPLPVVDDPTRCRRCDDVLRYGTDGNGLVTAWCVCGWRER